MRSPTKLPAESPKRRDCSVTQINLWTIFSRHQPARSATPRDSAELRDSSQAGNLSQQASSPQRILQRDGGERQLHPKSRALAQTPLPPYFSPLLLNNPLCDGEPQTSAS